MKAFRSLVPALALTACLSASHALAASGKLVLYTSQPKDQMVEVIDLFKEQHPGIDVEIFRSGTTEVMNKLNAEITAGDPKPDVLMTANVVDMIALKRENLLMPYTEAPVEGFDAFQYDKDMTYFGTKLITTGIIYNTAAGVPKPTSWKDLLKEEAKGQVIMPSPLYSGAAAVHVGTLVAQPELGWDYYEKLAANGALAGKGNGGVQNAVAKGEKAYGIIIDYMAIGARKKGSPVDFVFPSEGVTSINQPVAILSTAKNVEAAKAFVDFQLSDAAQKQSVGQSYLPLKEGIAPLEDYPAMSTIKVMTAPVDDLLDKADENKRKFADIYGG